MKQKSTPSYAVAALIVSPQGIPLVRDAKKPKPYYWKLPGGRSEGNETALEAVIRETKEETGLSFKPSDMELICEEKRQNHIFCLFQTNPVSLVDLRLRGSEGEEVGLFLPGELGTLSDFFPPHKKILEEIKYFKI